MLERNTLLGGHLVGIGKIRANGEVEYQELSKPIHNRITSAGLDHLFQWGGSTTPDITASMSGFATAFLVDKDTYSNGRAGALEYLSIGSGSTATAFTDTALVSPILSYQDTKYTNSDSSQNLNGTKVNSFGSYSFRVSHQTSTVSATSTINELGWFGGYGSDYGTKVMFARVVLPSAITLNSGEALITTYQLDMTCSNSTASTISDFFGLKDSNGNTLQAEQKLYMRKNTGSGWAVNIAHDGISTTGTKQNHTSYQSGGFVPAYYFNSHLGSYGYKYCYYYSNSSSTTFPADGSSSSLTALRSNTNFSVSSTVYQGEGSTNKYRDRIVTLGSLCPDMTSPSDYKDIYFLRLLNKDYRFGYYDNGVWTPQAWRKYANQSVTFTFRTRYSTEDTTLS